MALCVPLVMGIHPGQDGKCIDDVTKGPAWNDGVLIPPPKYDYEPTVPYIVIYKETNDAMTKACKEPLLDACAFTDLGIRHSCIIYARHAYADGADPVHVLRHEKAHCNGWPADHRWS